MTIRYSEEEEDEARRRFLLLPTGTSFVRWATSHDLTVNDVADIFEVTDTTARNWLEEDGFDKALGPAKMLLMAMEDDPKLLRVLFARAALVRQMTGRTLR